MKLKRFGLLTSLTILFATASGLAQDSPKIEITPYVGYTFSEGISIDPIDIGNGQIANELTPTSAFSWGAEFDYLLNDNWYVGFNYAVQDSTLQIQLQSSGERELTDMHVRNYHGIFGYNFGPGDSPVRPYIFGGLGATDYSPSDIMGQNVDGATKFSTTWGGGVKLYAGKNFGFRLGGRWTPTYINSTADGIWCSPYYPWGCWVVGNANYSNQFEMSGGVIFRF